MLTNDQIALMEKDMYGVAREKYQEEKLIHPEIYKMVNNVTGGGDKFTQILGANRLKEHTSETEDIDFHSPVQGWQAWVKYKTFSDGVNFSKNAVEDNVKNGEVGKTLKGYAATWGSAIRNEKEIYGANFFTYGGYTSGDAIYKNSWGAETDSSGNLFPDSKPFFNLTGNTRTTKGSGTYYNAISAGSLSATTFETLYVLVVDTNAYSEQDRRVANQVDTLMVQSASDELEAKRILGSSKKPGSDHNDTNPLEGIVKIVRNPYLTGGSFYIGKANSDELEWHDRQKPLIEFFRRTENRGYRASVDVRWGILAKPGCWRNWGRTAGSYAATK